MTAAMTMDDNENTYAAGENTASIRVDVGLLDTLMTLAGELVLSRNQLLQGMSTANTRATQVSTQRIDLITSELQGAIMRTRMQPISTLLNRFHRIIRDLSRDLGKTVRLDIDGGDVELDRNILEAISAPLTQRITDAVSHGIELPEEREQVGKTRSGNISLKAFHDAGQVNILLSDDGRGVVSSLTNVPDDPAGKGHDLCGTVERLGGVIEEDAVPGKGSLTHIKLPLTLAIIPSQIASVGDERFALPQVNLKELLRIPSSQVEKVGDADVIRLRGDILPILDLARVLGINRTVVDPDTGRTFMDRRKNIADRRAVNHLIDPSSNAADSHDTDLNRQLRSGRDRRRDGAKMLTIAVVSAGAFTYGLVVDQLHDSEEIVVKPLGRHLKHCAACAGATIMGDGSVALILDIANIAQLANLSTLSDAIRSVKSTGETNQAEKNRTALLTFRHSDHEHFALPLALVDRIERIPSSSLETIGTKTVVQYRGGALQLLDLSRIMAIDPLPERRMQDIIVLGLKNRELGLMVSPPVDTVEVLLDIDDGPLKQSGILGSIIINDRTTLLVDVDALEKLTGSGIIAE